MEKIWLLALSIFLVSTFLFWRLTRGYFRKEYGKKMWKNWVARTYHWQAVIYIGAGITLLALFILKWSNVLTF